MQTYSFIILVTIPGVFDHVEREYFTGTLDAAAQRVKTLHASFGKGYKVEAFKWRANRPTFVAR